MEGKPDWLSGFPVQIYCNRSDSMSRDPYLGIMGLMDDTAKGHVPTWCCLGEVVEAKLF